MIDLDGIPPERKTELRLHGPRTLLRPLVASDATERYVDWLNDPVVNRFLEIRFRTHTIDSVRTYVNGELGDPFSVLFGIFLAEGSKHIGNIRLGPISPRHLHAVIGLVVGDKEQWGKGYASEVIDVVSVFAFRELGMEKLFAGVYAENQASLRAFLRAGFQQEGVVPRHFLLDGKRVDALSLSRFASGPA